MERTGVIWCVQFAFKNRGQLCDSFKIGGHLHDDSVIKVPANHKSVMIHVQHVNEWSLWFVVNRDLKHAPLNIEYAAILSILLIYFIP